MTSAEGPSRQGALRLIAHAEPSLFDRFVAAQYESHRNGLAALDMASVRSGGIATTPPSVKAKLVGAISFPKRPAVTTNVGTMEIKDDFAARAARQLASPPCFLYSASCPYTSAAYGAI